jgi:hypothetical protein
MSFSRCVFAILVLAAAAYGVMVLKQLGGEARPRFDVLDATPGPDRPAPPAGGMTDTVRSPRFKVELIHVHAVDETGWFDWTGSDEIIVVYDTPQRRTITSTIEDVDSGETKLLPETENCIWPVVDTEGPGWACLAAGGAAPVVFAVSLWEEDNAIPYYDTGLGGVGFCVSSSPNMGCIEEPDDWLFSTQIFSYPEAELETRLPEPGTFFELEDEVSWVAPSDFEYWLKVRVTRVADVIEERPRELDPTPQ